MLKGPAPLISKLYNRCRGDGGTPAPSTISSSFRLSSRTITLCRHPPLQPAHTHTHTHTHAHTHTHTHTHTHRTHSTAELPSRECIPPCALPPLQTAHTHTHTHTHAYTHTHTHTHTHT